MDKYLKYKNKYLALKNKYIQQGGSNEYRVYINKKLYDTIIFYQNITLEDDKLKETLLENIDCTKYNIINKLNEDGITVTVDKENNINIYNPNEPTIQLRGDLHKMDLYLEQELNGGGADDIISAMNINVNKYLVNQEKTIGFKIIDQVVYTGNHQFVIFNIKSAIHYDITSYIILVFNIEYNIDNFICNYIKNVAKETEYPHLREKNYYYGTLYTSGGENKLSYAIIPQSYSTYY